MNFLSVCSGIEAASVAWNPLGWKAVGFAEIEPFPCALLAHRYPDVPNYGDMTKLPALIDFGLIAAPDMLCGGTPCQAFSVAGLRKSLDDARGNLSLVFCEIANAIDSARRDLGQSESIIFWENVPGVLNTKDNAFGCFLAGLAGEAEPLEPAGGKWSNAGYVLGPQRAVAWRVLDAQYFGVAQRRRRVFVVASARNDFDPAAILFEFDGVRRDTAPSREAGQEVAGSLASRTDGGGFPGTDEVRPVRGVNWPAEVAPTLDAHFGDKWGLEDQHINSGAGLFVPVAFDTTQVTSPQNYSNPKPGDSCHPLAAGAHVPAVCVTGEVTHTLKAEGFDASEDGTGRGQPIVTYSIQAGALRTNPASGPEGVGVQADHAYTLEARAEVQAVAFSSKDYGADAGVINPTLRGMGHHGSHANGGGQVAVVSAMQVRRLTPRECERLQGCPDDYTLIPVKGKPAADGPRYKALGNSWAVPNVAWIGRRIDAHLLGVL